MKFFGVVGYGETAEIRPGVWQDVITEKQYYGDILSISRSSRGNQETVNNDIAISNRFSLMADAYAYENFSKIRFIEWMGTLWTVPSVDVQRPRLILSVGEVYHGNRQVT